MSEPKSLIPKVTEWVEEFMSRYDGSHDFLHIKRVVGRAHDIYAKMSMMSPLDSASSSADDISIANHSLDLSVIILAALLHDVGDKKYLRPGEDHTTLAQNILLDLGASVALAEKVQTICLAVSYTSEIKDLQHVQDVLAKYPELAVVQDADRLDALGAVGIGRFFTYGGAKGERSMEESIGVTEKKLVNLEGMMKTPVGKEMARELTQRLKLFRQWWNEECLIETAGSAVLEVAIEE